MSATIKLDFFLHSASREGVFYPLFSYEHFHCSSLKGRSSFRLGNIKPAEFYQLLARHYWLTCTGNTLCRNFIYIEDVEDCVHDTWYMIHDSQKLFRFRQLLVLTDGSVDSELRTNLVSSVANRENTPSFKKTFPVHSKLAAREQLLFSYVVSSNEISWTSKRIAWKKVSNNMLWFPFRFFCLNLEWSWNNVEPKIMHCNFFEFCLK